MNLMLLKEPILYHHWFLRWFWNELSASYSSTGEHDKLLWCHDYPAPFSSCQPHHQQYLAEIKSMNPAGQVLEYERAPQWGRDWSCPCSMGTIPSFSPWVLVCFWIVAYHVYKQMLPKYPEALSYLYFFCQVEVRRTSCKIDRKKWKSTYYFPTNKLVPCLLI